MVPRAPRKTTGPGGTVLQEAAAGEGSRKAIGIPARSHNRIVAERIVMSIPFLWQIVTVGQSLGFGGNIFSRARRTFPPLLGSALLIFNHRALSPVSAIKSRVARIAA
jgi:hypothetical protein